MKSGKRQFPAELTHEILRQIPQQQLMECRQVCRDWNSEASRLMFRDPFNKQLWHVDQSIQSGGGRARRNSELWARGNFGGHDAPPVPQHQPQRHQAEAQETEEPLRVGHMFNRFLKIFTGGRVHDKSTLEKYQQFMSLLDPTFQVIDEDDAATPAGCFRHHSIVLTSHTLSLRQHGTTLDIGALVKCLDVTLLVQSRVSVGDGDLRVLARKCRDVLQLKLSGAFHVTDVGLMQFAGCVQNLQQLDLSGLTAVTDMSVSQLLSCSTHLKSINLKNCSRLTDASVVAVAEHCKHLQRLRLSGCHQVSDSGIYRLVEFCHRIKWLDLSGCVQIGDGSLLALAQYCPELQWLDVSRNVATVEDSLLSDEGIMAIVDACEQLELLDVSYCAALTDKSLCHLASQSEHLKSLSLKGLNRITETSIYALGELRRKHHRLIWLQIYNCRHITGEVIDNMIKRLNDGWRKGPYDRTVHNEVMGKGWE